MSGNRYSYSRENFHKKRYINGSRGKRLAIGRANTSSRRWVRPTPSVSSTVSEEIKVSIDSEKKSETTTAVDVISTELEVGKGSKYIGNGITKNGEGPILRVGLPPPSRVWRRSSSATSSQSSREYFSHVSGCGKNANEEKDDGENYFVGGKKNKSPSFPKNAIVPPVIVTTATNMKRHGTNKLVLAGEVKNPSTHSKKEEIKFFERGENKIILKKKNKPIIEESASVDSQKLLSNTSRKRPVPSMSSVDNSHTWKRKDGSGGDGDKSSGGKKFRGILANTTSVRRGQERGANIKRIQLNAVPSPKSNEKNKPMSNDSRGDDEGDKEKTDTEVDESRAETPILTDFAYREVSFNSATSNKRPMTINRSSSNTSYPKNMGLVRVKPNPKQTPAICPIILRGISCTDPKCKKRHDLSRESVTPLCSYFQKNGQCLKGKDCPFRHVKVNARAEVCPSFSYLGYCEDPNCTMKHVRQKRQQQQHSRRPFSLKLKTDAGASSSLPERNMK